MHFRYYSNSERSVEAVQFLSLNNVNNYSINIIRGVKNVLQHKNTHMDIVLRLILTKIVPIEM